MLRIYDGVLRDWIGSPHLKREMWATPFAGLPSQLFC